MASVVQLCSPYFFGQLCPGGLNLLCRTKNDIIAVSHYALAFRWKYLIYIYLIGIVSSNDWLSFLNFFFDKFSLYVFKHYQIGRGASEIVLFSFTFTSWKRGEQNISHFKWGFLPEAFATVVALKWLWLWAFLHWECYISRRNYTVGRISLCPDRYLIVFRHLF